MAAAPQPSLSSFTPPSLLSLPLSLCVAVDCLILQICYADNSVKSFCLPACILCQPFKATGCQAARLLFYLYLSVVVYLCSCVSVPGLSLSLAVKCDSNHTTHRQITSRFHSLSFAACHSALQNYFFHRPVEDL